MKSKLPEKKQTLKLKVDKAVRFRLIGISCHENDYRLVWAINQQLRMQFVRGENLVMTDIKLKTDMEFSRFVFHDEDRYMKYYLISNRCPNGFLFPEIKNLDFLIQLNGDVTQAQIREFQLKLKRIEIISAVFVLQPDRIKNISSILLDNLD